MYIFFQSWAHWDSSPLLNLSNTHNLASVQNSCHSLVWTSCNQPIGFYQDMSYLYPDPKSPSHSTFNLSTQPYLSPHSRFGAGTHPANQPNPQRPSQFISYKPFLTSRQNPLSHCLFFPTCSVHIKHRNNKRICMPNSIINQYEISNKYLPCKTHHAWKIIC